jgi:5-methylcytosine-specific restriction endonuclease McrA
MAECRHGQTEIRARPTAAGTAQYAHQCVLCGARVGQWVKKPLGDVPSWDEWAEAQERDARFEAARVQGLKEYHARRETQSQLWWRGYQWFLKSDQWKAIRRRVLTRAGGKCEACLAADAQQVHHTVYPVTPYNETLPVSNYTTAVFQDLLRQPLFELRAVCYECHVRIHPHMEAAA